MAGVKPARTRRVRGRTFRYYRAADIGHLFGGSTVSEAWEELLGLRADIIEIRRRIRQRRNLPIADYQAAVADRIATAKQRVVVLPGKLCEQLVGIEPAGQLQIIDRELDEIAADLAAPFSWEPVKH